MDHQFHRHCACFDHSDDWRSHHDDSEAAAEEEVVVREARTSLPSATPRTRRRNVRQQGKQAARSR